MCVLCPETSKELKNLNKDHIDSKIKDLDKSQIKAVLDSLPNLIKECATVGNEMIYPKKKRAIDQLINHLFALETMLKSQL